MPSHLHRQIDIRPEAHTYGCLVGLSLERGDLHYSANHPGRMFARFEHQDRTFIHTVPDWELFTLLSKHLCDNARARAQTGNYAYAHLTIQKNHDGWTISTT